MLLYGQVGSVDGIGPVFVRIHKTLHRLCISRDLEPSAGSAQDYSNDYAEMLYKVVC